MLFKTKTELFKYLKKFDYKAIKDTKFSSVYFLTKYNDIIEPLVFVQFENLWYPAPCKLRKTEMSEEQMMEYVKNIYSEEDFAEALKFERIFQKGNWHYEIDSRQTYPFLPKQIEILDALSDEDCLKWLLDNRNEE